MTVHFPTSPKQMYEHEWNEKEMYITLLINEKRIETDLNISLITALVTIKNFLSNVKALCVGTLCRVRSIMSTIFFWMRCKFVSDFLYIILEQIITQ